GVSIAAVFVAVIVLLNQRINKTRVNAIPGNISNLGYAVPGTVLAIGVLIVTSIFDKSLSNISEWLGFGKQGQIIGGTLFVMGYAFLTRFAAIGIGSVETGLNKIPTSLDDTAYLFSYKPINTIQRVFLPLLRNSALTAFMLVFLESMKELSAAILLRPFNIETLATYVYQYMSAEQFEVAALPALVIVLAGIPPVLILTASMKKNT
nr:iron ABC transporter permease [Gammaproteobacteria bacterium]